jgi:di/tricarboxylate transporter
MNGHDYSVDLTEVIIPPRSNAIGKTLVDLGFRNKYGLTSVALWREGHSYRTDVGKTPLQVGDALLMVGPVTKIKRLASERDYMLLQSSHIYQPPHPQKAKWALLLIAFVLVTAITGVIALPVAVLLAWVGVIVSGIMSMDDAYRAVEWRVVFLIGGMLAIGPAMIHTGLADRLGSALVYYVEPFGPLALLGGMYILAMLTAQFIGGQVTPLVMGPIALTAAIQAGVDPRAMAITVAIGCISGFLTPLAHPVNILMMGPGGYVFADFPRVGIGLIIVTFLVLMLMMRVLWGIA